MSVQIDIRPDIEGAQRMLLKKRNAVIPAAVRSMNRTITTVRMEANKKLKPLYPAVKASTLKARMKLVKANRSTLQAALRFKSTRIPLFGNFGMRRRGRFGVSFRSLPWRIETAEGEAISPSMLQTNAFINKLQRGGRETVLLRLGDRRLPISVLLATGLSKAVVDKGVLAAMKEFAGPVFRKNFAHEMSRASALGGGE